MRDVLFVVVRDFRDEATVAVVQADLTLAGEKAGLDREEAFLRHLQDAVTGWVKETMQGRKAWHESSHDFNIGDLAVEDRPVLDEIAARMDGFVTSFSVNVFSATGMGRRWTFDTVLVDRKLLNE